MASQTQLSSTPRHQARLAILDGTTYGVLRVLRTTGWKYGWRRSAYNRHARAKSEM